MIQHIATDEMKVSDLLSSDDSVLSNLCPNSGPGTCKIGPILTQCQMVNYESWFVRFCGKGQPVKYRLVTDIQPIAVYYIG